MGNVLEASGWTDCVSALEHSSNVDGLLLPGSIGSRKMGPGINLVHDIVVEGGLEEGH